MRKKLSIYIHIPFCVKKCVYCDFLSFGADDPQINRSGAVRKAYVQSICRELLSYKSISKDYIVKTIFIGGGTPSILLPGEIMNILATLRSIFKVDEEAEITIEVNPGTLTAIKAAEYLAAGINRMSIGLQSAHNDELAMLGRIHTYEQFINMPRQSWMHIRSNYAEAANDLDRKLEISDSLDSVYKRSS